TVLVDSTPVYSSDFTGLAVDEIERDWTGSVVAFFNGGEGDVAARRTTRDVLEARERAGQFRDAIRRILTQPARTLDPRILVRAKLIDASSEENRTCTWSSASAGRHSRDPGGRPVSLAARPVFG